MSTLKEICSRVPLLDSVYGFPDACALAAAYAEGVVDPVEIARRCLEEGGRHAAVYVSLTPERALREAQASRERHRAGMPLSLFDGVPLNWKDTFDVAGTVTTSGSALFCSDPPSKADGPLPLAAARGGMVCIGKVNTCEFAYSSVGVNRRFGSPVNPHSPPNAPRSCGGSSSGSGASVSAGLIPLSMGSDTGGSIRVPASFTGICGFKPTSGRYSRQGLKALARTLDSPGPMARSVRDLVVMDGILRGTWRIVLPDVSALPDLRGRRFVADTAVLDSGLLTEAVSKIYLDALDRLEAAGARVERRVVRAFHDARASIAKGWIMGAEVFTELKELLGDPEKAARMDQRVRGRAELSRSMPPEAVVRSYWDRQRLMEAMRGELEDAVLILPSVGHTAPLLKPLETDDDAFAACVQANPRLTAAGNFLNMPAVAVPAGTDADGMPAGLSLYKNAGDDELLLLSALAVEPVIRGG